MKMINSWGNNFHQVSWGLDKNCGLFINGEFLNMCSFFLLRLYLWPTWNFSFQSLSWNSVKESVPEEKLLIFSVKEGWEPLCNFLELPIPNEPFPNTNDTKMMKKTIRIIKIASYCLVFGLVPAVTIGFSLFLARQPSASWAKLM